MHDQTWDQITEAIVQATGAAFNITNKRSVGGGSINRAYAVSSGNQAFFVKLNDAMGLPMFEAEALGLRQIEQSNTIRVPHVVTWGLADRASYIVLEWLDLGHGSRQAWTAMGQNLAAMHQVTSDRGFGWDQNNTIGSTPQPNPWTAGWLEFWIEHRLRFQFQLAKRRGGHFPQQNALLDAVPDLLAGHTPEPSLVHGDLWSGNAAVTTADDPVILDPATYFGDREVDLAMTELFGRFPPEFYKAYDQTYPLESGYERRKILYNLYHILNHFNLFGSGYESQANSMMASLLR